MSDIEKKIDEYLLVGGLNNPELMQHEKLRDLLIACRDEIERLQRSVADWQLESQIFRSNYRAASAGIERLRLTDAERALIEKLTTGVPIIVTREDRDAATALLDRHARKYASRTCTCSGASK